MPSIRHLTLGDLEHALRSTRRVLARVPMDKLDWRPHPKSMSLGELAMHTAAVPFIGITMLQHDAWDMAGPRPPRPPMPATTDELLAHFDGHVTQLVALLDGTDDAAMTAIYEVRRGEQVLMSQPRAAMLRTMVPNHLIHHRAQLGVYLRLLDVPVPAVYGNSADENPMAG